MRMTGGIKKMATVYNVTNIHDCLAFFLGHATSLIHHVFPDAFFCFFFPPSPPDLKRLLSWVLLCHTSFSAINWLPPYLRAYQKHMLSLLLLLCTSVYSSIGSILVSVRVLATDYVFFSFFFLEYIFMS